MRLFKPRYITLQDELTEQDQVMLEQAISTSLPRMIPSDTFVRELESRLLAEARRRQTVMTVAKHDHSHLGIIGGGLLSVVGGLAVWLYLNAHKDVAVHPTTV